MKAVMYHYVRPVDANMPFFKALHIDDFKKQLDYFEQEFGIATYEDMLEVKNGKLLDKIILTFDDAISDHYEYVFPELKKRGITGVFYIPTQPYLNNKMLDVHKVHLILGSIESKIVLEKLNSYISYGMLQHTNEFEEKTYNYQTNDECTLQVKRILNYFLSYQYRTKIIDMLFLELLGEQSDYCASFYMNTAQLKELSDNAMIIGSHSISHPVFSRLSKDLQRVEIEDSFNFLSELGVINDFKTFCYPYGGDHSFNQDTVDLLNESNVDFSFSVDPCDIKTLDLNKIQTLSRYDCNHFKYGQCRTVL
ncbi:polysaccharide deacetylase family protein [Moritella sp. 24]|uniref:polysaccharide deacetylase family protein n=1 Tax=Moritella sp. 24 TaxID=2746230 RepID=UPI001BADDBAF|nr:polysaccharide deacetylase family protein [Moritella sp. 24]QUM77862.1 polysaccharide deacetylase family protein [Moritella sp. 24]